MHKIIPLNIPVVGTVTRLSIQVNPFNLFPATIQLYITLRGEDAFYEKNITVPADVVAQWGTDDTVVLDYVVAQLGVELDTTPDPEPSTPHGELPTEE